MSDAACFIDEIHFTGALCNGPDSLCGMVQIVDELSALLLPIFMIGHPQNGGGVISGGDPSGVLTFEELPAMLSDAEVAAQHCLRGSCAEAHDHVRFHDEQL